MLNYPSEITIVVTIGKGIYLVTHPATLWTKFKPVAELPQDINPSTGYLWV